MQSRTFASASQRRHVSLRSLFGIVFALGALVASASAEAQGFPSRPIRIVLPYTVGGPTDFLSRTVAERLSPWLGQPVVIESRPGANAQLATAHVARSPRA